MSGDDSITLTQRAYRTVTPGSKMHPNASMDSIGWAIFLGLVVLMLPLLPFIAIVYTLSKLFGYLAAQRGTDTEP
ncbi:hypothetical protein C440_07107 [Haloferax mucosum ATCC BAA-1512]|uniref:Uncharacterized protein n=1 Tax=Haloferax mucosum ATCC BAA-1512 TaxID=662479 RepID=M0IH84_9EURY|nr:hypothetical protein [Haloferax mucosum]ELZ94824.1 hypothetical protein C440_07107 [Haloferax mucosum ATCC BAA-1512]